MKIEVNDGTDFRMQDFLTTMHGQAGRNAASFFRSSCNSE